MKKYLSFMIVAVLIATFTISCEKDKPVPPPVVVKPSLIKSVKAIYNATEWEVWNFTYDAERRLTKVENFWLTDFDKAYDYNYSVAGKLSITRTGQSPVVYDLDTQGRITKEYKSGGEYNLYEYNTDGYLVKVKEFWGGIERLKWNVEITNGNVTKHTRYGDDGVLVNRIKTFTYTPGDNANNIDQVVVVDSPWRTASGLYGKPSKKLVDFLDYWNGPGDEPNTKRTTIAYMFDTKNRVSKITRSGVGWQEIFEYTYYD